MAASHRRRRAPAFAALQRQILEAKQRAAWAVNREMVTLFWRLGREIVAREATGETDGRIVEHLAEHLRVAFSETKCFSGANLERMRHFAKAWPDFEAAEPLLTQLPWEVHIVLLSKLKTPKQRLAYARRARELGWSSTTLALHIDRRRERLARS